MTFGAGQWPAADDDDRQGPNPLTPEQARRYRASMRFPVGSGVLLREIDPARPATGGAVVIMADDRVVRGIAVLTDTGPRPRDHAFALWVPSAAPGSCDSSALLDLLDEPWLLVEAGLTWNDVTEILSRSEVHDVATFEQTFLVLEPTGRRRVSMIAFDAVPLPPPVSDPQVRISVPPGDPDAATIDDLATAIDVLASIKQAYAAYECDYQRVLAAPALADVAEDSTAAFVDAFHLAVGLEPERPEHCPPTHVARFTAAVAAAENAWEAAESNAIRLGIAGYDPVQRTQIRRARQALDLALRPDTPAGEREVSLATARRLLDGLITFPAPLESVIAVAIPATRRAALER